MYIKNRLIKGSFWRTINTEIIVVTHYKVFILYQITSEHELTIVLKYEALSISCLTRVWNCRLIETLWKPHISSFVTTHNLT